SRNRKSHRTRHRRTALVAAPTRLGGDKHKNDYAAAVPFTYLDPDISADGRVAAILHIFYEDLADELREQLDTIPGSPDLFISTTDETKKERIRRIFESWPGQVEIKVVENRGRDIAPKLLAFRDCYQRYDYILHAHTKLSPHDTALAGWRQYLLKTLLGNSAIVSSVFHAFSHNPKLGMVAP